MFPDRYISTLTYLSQVLFRKPSPDDLCQVLATLVSPCGEISRVYCGRVDNDGLIRTFAAFGFSLESNVMNIVTSIDQDKPMPDAVRHRKVIVGNRDDILRDYPNYKSIDERSPWAATAVIPTLGRLVYVFRLQCTIEDKEFAQGYFTTLGTILNLFDYSTQEQSHQSRQLAKEEQISNLEPTKNLKGMQLTDRQLEILEQIRERKTNIQIALNLGYSESLIRQETMIIYSKLGVSGRKEILSNLLEGVS